MAPTPFADPATSWRSGPVQGRPEQLMILLPDTDAAPEDLAPLQQLAEALRPAFPQALLLAWPMLPTAQAAAARVMAAAAGEPAAELAPMLQALVAEVRQAQQAGGVGPAATALVGFGVGALLALELSALEDGLAGRVLAFGGRYARLPAQAPRHSTLHLFHGADDDRVPARHARQALEHLGRLQGDATLDIASGTGHALAPALIDCALHRLRSHIPHRTWAAALGMVPGLSGRTEPGLDS